MIKEGKFRQDLFYRLNVFPIVIPPLRQRPEDIPALVWHMLEDLGQRMGRSIEVVHAPTMQEFQKYSWPGNVRELRNVIERNLILNSGSTFRAEVPELEQKLSRAHAPISMRLSRSTFATSCRQRVGASAEKEELRKSWA